MVSNLEIRDEVESSSSSSIVASNQVEWVTILLEEKFFTACSVHESLKKNEKTFFCLYCRLSICSHCLSSHKHRTHSILQIRRYVYHDVIRLGDAHKLLNCSLVQPYTTNSAKVVFLKQRATTTTTTRPLRGSATGNFCITCFRTLQQPYLYCSLSCKIHNEKIDKTEIYKKHEDHVQQRSKERSEILSEVEENPSSISNINFPCLSNATVANSEVEILPSVAIESSYYTAANKSIKKKRSCVNSLTDVLCRARVRCFPVVADITTAVNRRKGVPQRSPLY